MSVFIKQHSEHKEKTPLAAAWSCDQKDATGRKCLATSHRKTILKLFLSKTSFQLIPIALFVLRFSGIPGLFGVAMGILARCQKSAGKSVLFA